MQIQIQTEIQTELYIIQNAFAKIQKFLCKIWATC